MERNPKIGYYINAAKKRKQQQQQQPDPEQEPAEESNAERPPLAEPARKKAQPQPKQQQQSSQLASGASATTSGHSSDPTTDKMDIDPMDLGAGAPSSAGGASTSQHRHARHANGSSGGNSAGGSSSAGVRGTVALWSGIRQNPQLCTRIYKKEYLFRLANEHIEVQCIAGTTTNAVRSIRYPFHDIPVNMLGFYLSKAEIKELMRFTKCEVESVSVQVYNKTGCLNFETASSTSNIGNNNVGIYLCELTPDIMSRRSGILPNQGIFIHEKCWGKPAELVQAAGWNNNVSQLGAQYVRRNMDNKFEYNTFQDSSNFGPKAVAMDVQFPYFNVMPFIGKRVNASMTEGLFTEYHYKPKKGLVAGQFIAKIRGHVANDNNHYVLKNSHLPIMERHVDNGGNQYFGMLSNSAGQAANIGSGGLTQTSMMLDRFTNFKEDDFENIMLDDPIFFGKNVQPPLVIGIEPLTTSLNDKWEAVKAFVDITIHVELVMKIQQGVDYINPNTTTCIIPDYQNPEYIPSVADAENVLYPLTAPPNRISEPQGNVTIAHPRLMDHETPTNTLESHTRRKRDSDKNYEALQKSLQQKVNTPQQERMILRSDTNKLKKRLEYLESKHKIQVADDLKFFHR